MKGISVAILLVLALFATASFGAVLDQPCGYSPVQPPTEPPVDAPFGDLPPQQDQPEPTAPPKSGTQPQPAPTPTQPEISSWQLIWSDEFEGPSIDSSKWTHEVGCSGIVNGERQCYTDSSDNSFVADGVLHIKAISKPPQPATNPDSNLYSTRPCESNPYSSDCSRAAIATSARLTTMVSENSNVFKYGRFEARMKLPKGSWLWPSLWMLPQLEYYGAWPASGEINVMDARSQEPNTVVQGIRYGGAWPFDKQAASAVSVDSDLSDDFHVYGLQWNETDLYWILDGTTTRHDPLTQSFGGSHQTKNAPFDKPFYMVLSLAVGGSMFPKSKYGAFDTKAGGNWTQPFQIDWVKVYQKGNATALQDPLERSPEMPARQNLVAYPVADTYLSTYSEYQRVPFGGDALMHVTKSADTEETALLKFYLDTDVSGVKTAELRLWTLVESNTSASDRSVALHSSSAAWDEATVTSLSKPTLGDLIVSKVVEAGMDWLTFDVTDYVKATVSDANRLVSLAIKPDGDGPLSVLFQSKEAQTHQPRLKLIFNESDTA